MGTESDKVIIMRLIIVDNDIVTLGHVLNENSRKGGWAVIITLRETPREDVLQEPKRNQC
jgi:hypothetical protein